MTYPNRYVIASGSPRGAALRRHGSIVRIGREPIVDEVAFTAGITMLDGQVLTVDVSRIDGDGISWTTEEEGPRTVPWSEVKAVMLATVDHMLETGGYLFSMSELVQEHDESRPYDGPEMRRFALGLLFQAAPRVCPLGDRCGLRPGPQEAMGA